MLLPVIARKSARTLRVVLFSLTIALVNASTPAVSMAVSGEPIQLAYEEGDLAGLSTILGEDGRSAIGFIEYRQSRHGEILEISRIARFLDGSSDEDQIEASVGKTLRTIRGRSIIRDTHGTPTVDLVIDVAGGRIHGFSGLGKKRENYDEKVALPPATYWGPLIAIVVKNFDRNATDNRLVFHTVVATPKPRVFDMALDRKETTLAKRAGGTVKAVRFALSPTFNMLLDPIIRIFIPDTDFLMQTGKPPAVVRFQGPRNYAGQKIRIE